MRTVSAVLGLALSAPLLYTADAPHVFTPAQKSYWAFQPVKKSPVPSVKDKAWVKTPIDAFILAKLEEKNLQPNPRADKLTLLRRATIDMTGLPPTQEEIQAFLSDKSPERVGKSGRPAAGFARLRRALGPALAGRRRATPTATVSRPTKRAPTSGAIAIT